ncbi:MAG: TonB-dependent receptor, partial [Cytophagales bacterium]
DALGRPFSSSWITLNLKTGYHVSDHTSIRFGIENITDQRYRPYSSGIAAAGRNFIGSLAVSF